jgi:hypothetical protein
MLGDHGARSRGCARRWSSSWRRSSAKMRRSISPERSCAVRILLSSSFSSGVVKRSALTSVCLRS